MRIRSNAKGPIFEIPPSTSEREVILKEHLKSFEWIEVKVVPGQPGAATLRFPRQGDLVCGQGVLAVCKGQIFECAHVSLYKIKTGVIDLMVPW